MKIEKAEIEKLEDHINYKKQTFRILDRSENVLICSKSNEDDQIEYLVGLITKVFQGSLLNHHLLQEYIEEFDWDGVRSIFEYDDRKSAMMHYRKLVEEHG